MSGRNKESLKEEKVKGLFLKLKPEKGCKKETRVLKKLTQCLYMETWRIPKADKHLLSVWLNNKVSRKNFNNLVFDSNFWRNWTTY